MANQPGYRTLVDLEDDIIIAIRGQLISFSGLLFQHGLIDIDEYDEARITRNPVQERARNVMAAVRNRVTVDESCFETLLTIFDQDRAQNRVIIGRLWETYEQRGTNT